MPKHIDNFQGQYRFLSNFYPAVIEYNEKLWPTVEHAYQAAKTTDPKLQEQIRLAKSPGQAKRLGANVLLREDWHKVRVSIMDNLVRIKFDSHPDLAKALLATEDAELVEGNHWHDNFWGRCVCERCDPPGWYEESRAKNHLGRILMRVRRDLVAALRIASTHLTTDLILPRI